MRMSLAGVAIIAGSRRGFSNALHRAVAIQMSIECFPSGGPPALGFTIDNVSFIKIYPIISR
jgi:hypothetical protein